MQAIQKELIPGMLPFSRELTHINADVTKTFLKTLILGILIRASTTERVIDPKMLLDACQVYQK